MLDERTSALLEKINELCGEGGFKIAEEGELLSCFAETPAKEELMQMLGELKERRYIDVKYAEEGVYCLRPLPEGKLYFETLRAERREGARRRADVLGFSALGGMLGSLLGALIVWLIVLLARGV